MTTTKLLDTPSLEHLRAIVSRATNHLFQAEAIAFSVGVTAGVSAFGPAMVGDLRLGLVTAAVRVVCGPCFNVSAVIELA